MISTHILDTSKGLPASGVSVRLEIETDGVYRLLSEQATNADGRIAFDVAALVGVYRLTFAVAAYFERQGGEAFFLDTPVVFHVRDVARKYHVPLLLNPFGYSTYRGS